MCFTSSLAVKLKHGRATERAFDLTGPLIPHPTLSHGVNYKSMKAWAKEQRFSHRSTDTRCRSSKNDELLLEILSCN